MEKLQWIPKTIMKISVFQYFDIAYISAGIRNALSTHGLGNTSLIIFVRTGQQ